MKFGKILKAVLTVVAVYKANEEELKPLVAMAKKVVGRRRKA